MSPEYNPWGQNRHMVNVTVTVDGHSIVNTVPVHCNWPTAQLHSLDRFSKEELLAELGRRFIAEAEEEDE